MTDRVPVQGDGRWYLSPDDPRSSGAHRPGTVSREEHDAAWEAYRQLFGDSQSSDRIIERGGFSYRELTTLLGREPTSYEPTEARR